MKRNIAIFASGNGSNAENIAEYFRQSPADADAGVALIVCNKPDAYVISRAERLGIPCRVLPKAQINDPEVILPLLDSYGIDIIALAGYLLLIPEFMVRRYEGRMVNIHPSLLPKYGGKGMHGARIHQAVIDNGDTETGITVHLVNERCDEGSIIFQHSIPVTSDDTAETVETRIHALEKEYFPRVIHKLVLGLKDGEQ